MNMCACVCACVCKPGKRGDGFQASVCVNQGVGEWGRGMSHFEPHFKERHTPHYFCLY